MPDVGAQRSRREATLSNRIRALGRRYAPDAERPLTGYVGALTGFAGLVASLTVRVARRGGPPERPAASDLALAAVATFRASRLLTEASVTAPLRAPFTRYEGPTGAGEVAESVQEPDGGHRHAVGELLSCPYCLGVWIATGLSFGLVLSPAWTRLLAGTLTVDATADVLHKLYSDLQAR